MEAHKNLMPDVISKPWGSERVIVKNDLYVVKEIYVKAGHRLSLQYHKEKNETMILVSGKAKLYVETYAYKPEIYEPKDMLYMCPYKIPPGHIHRLETHEEDCLVVEVSTPHLDDTWRLEDDYGRIDESR